MVENQIRDHLICVMGYQLKERRPIREEEVPITYEKRLLVTDLLEERENKGESEQWRVAGELIGCSPVRMKILCRRWRRVSCWET